MNFKMILNWLFRRILGLRDIPLFFKVMKARKSNNLLKGESWGTINVRNDEQIDRWIESMPAGTESCPYWYSTRLIRGNEVNALGEKETEYWVGIRCTFLAPFIPIPICSEEIVFKIGFTDEIFYNCKKKYGRAYSLILNKDEYTHKIIDSATVKFKNIDVTYNNDEIWSSYDK